MTSESRSRGWTLGGGLALLAALLLCAASSGETVRAGLWKSRPGAGPRWASPELDDAAWKAVPLPATWREQGYTGLDGMVWFRRAVPLGDAARLAARRGRPPPALLPAPAGDRAPVVRPPGPLLRGQHLRQLLLDLPAHRPLRPRGPDQRSHRPRRRDGSHPVPLDLLLPPHLPAFAGLSALAWGAGPVRRLLAGRAPGGRPPEPALALAAAAPGGGGAPHRPRGVA